MEVSLMGDFFGQADQVYVFLFFFCFIYYFNVTHTLIVPTGTDCVFNKEKKKKVMDNLNLFNKTVLTTHFFYVSSKLFNILTQFYFILKLLCYQPIYTIKK